MGDTKTLLPCPFCGGDARKQENGRLSFRYWEVVCDKCDFCGPGHDTEAEAITAWNRRASHEARIAELEGLLERARDGVRVWHGVAVQSGKPLIQNLMDEIDRALHTEGE